MKNRSLLTLVVWGLLALFIMRTCAGEGEKPSESIQSFRAESFEAPAGEEQFVVLENDLLWTKWSTLGGTCVEARLKEFHSSNSEEALLLLKSVPAQAPPVGRNPGREHHRRRDGLRLFEPEGNLGVSLDAVHWEMGPAQQTGDGGAELLFTLNTPTGVRMEKLIRLSGLREGDNSPADEQRLIEVDISAEPNGEISSVVVGDLNLRLATGGGIVAEPDSFYPNPYAAAARLEYDKVEELETYNPRGSLPPRRDVSAKWNGQFAFVVEGSKYFLNLIRPLDKPFRGATAETLFDTDGFETGVLQRFEPEMREKIQKVAWADSKLRQENGGVQVGSEALGLETNMSGAEARRLRSSWYQAAREQREESWKRSSIAGDFRLHIGQAGTAGETQRFEWYLGPKNPEILSSPSFRPMDAVIQELDYGGSFFYRMFFTGAIAPTILWIIDFFHTITGNWGIAIILMTLLVRALMFPINRTSQMKMGAYQAKVGKLKPQVEKINQKYAKDPAKKQQATMELYREHKLSPPIGGCLPILLQFPVFIGLFAALRCSILLRQEPFALWIQDLSRPDALIDFGGPIANLPLISSVTSLNVLPIIMVVLWVWHQRSMPKPTDPQQAQMQKMMTFMPIMFGIMLYNYAAGLSLYMITSSALGIFEQKVIKKKWPVP
ncbi:MAG: membrane protein insertase YidC, partial [Planctomycetota bacterium]|nr:membrane protein insertase YidC [Planctomycetota bacterium]